MQRGCTQFQSGESMSHHAKGPLHIHAEAIIHSKQVSQCHTHVRACKRTSPHICRGYSPFQSGESMPHACRSCSYATCMHRTSPRMHAQDLHMHVEATLHAISAHSRRKQCIVMSVCACKGGLCCTGSFYGLETFIITLFAF